MAPASQPVGEASSAGPQLGEVDQLAQTETSAAEDSDVGSATSASASEPEGWNSDDEPPEDHIGDERVCSRDGRVRKSICRIGHGLEQPGQNDIVHVRYRLLSGTSSGMGGAASEIVGDPDALAAELKDAKCVAEKPVETMAASEETAGEVVDDAYAPMGDDRLPLAVEFALRCMRVGEKALVTGPAAYAAKASPLCGRKLRNRGAGRLPAAGSAGGGGRVPRKLRFSPAAPNDLASRARAEKTRAARSSLACHKDRARVEANADPAATPAAASSESWGGGEPSAAATAPPAFRAEVELLGIQTVSVLTEDGRVKKQLLCQGNRARRTPRLGDLVSFTLWEVGEENGPGSYHRCLLGDGDLPEADLHVVLSSMYEGERCLAVLHHEPSDMKAASAANVQGAVPADADATATEGAPPRCNGAVSADATTQRIRRLVVAMHKWLRRDVVPVPLPGRVVEVDAEAQADANECPCLQKSELCPGPTRLAHAIEDGSIVLVGLWSFGGDGGVAEAGSTGHQPTTEGCAAGCGAAADPRLLLSWRAGEGTVPGYLEAAVCRMRVAESAAFEMPLEDARKAPPGPSFEGQTPLRRMSMPELRPLVDVLLLGDEECQDDIRAGRAARASLAESEEDGTAGGETKPPPVQLPDSRTPDAWADLGEPVTWQELRLDTVAISFRLTLLAATEAPDVCLMDEQEQGACLERERARGNVLARAGRYAEAEVAYNKAVDVVRRTATYKALFPTEHGRITGAYTRDPCEAENPDPLASLEGAEIEKRRSSFVALHLNLALCATKCGRPSDTRRHSSVVLGAEPNNVKALFRRGSAHIAQGDLSEALADLQRAAELEPQDRAVREELRLAKQRLTEHRQAEKAMFANAFKPPPRDSGDATCMGSAASTASNAPQGEPSASVVVPSSSEEDVKND
mmetsp:Transcript_41008/g.112813  ORF Transcript_41008/g.112813 Transcript_41008/m.112813 type:complete len:918 (-) Transcript_41008:113-2866(-)